MFTSTNTKRRARRAAWAGGSVLAMLALTAPGASAATSAPLAHVPALAVEMGSQLPHAAQLAAAASGGLNYSSLPCSTGPDDTSTVQAIINAAPDGTPAHPTVINFPAGACYSVDQSVTLDKRNNLVLESDPSDPAVFVRQGVGTCTNQAQCYIFFLHGGSNITFKNVDVVSNNTQHVYQAANQDSSAWWVWGTQGLTLTHDTVENLWGDFVTVGPDTYRTWKWSTNVDITDDNFNGSGRQGISITGAENVNISNNVIANAALSSFDIEPDSGTGPVAGGVPTYGGAEYVTIDNNVVGQSGTTFVSDYGACAQVSNITVADNTLQGAPLTLWVKGCSTVHRSNWTVAGNTSNTPFASPRGAIEMTYTDTVDIANNSLLFYVPEKVTAVKVWGCSDVAVSGNTFNGAVTSVALDPPVWDGPASTSVTTTHNNVS
jgi:hypothetical protein